MRLGQRELAWHASTRNLFEYVRGYMPFDRPRTLTEQEYLDVVAFLLYRTELLPANQIVSEETLDEIQLPPFRSP